MKWFKTKKTQEREAEQANREAETKQWRDEAGKLSGTLYDCCVDKSFVACLTDDDIWALERIGGTNYDKITHVMKHNSGRPLVVKGPPLDALNREVAQSLEEAIERLGEGK